MAIINHHFPLNDARIKRLNSAGIRSLRELADVLAALDLRAVVYLEEMSALPSSPPEKESEHE